VSHRIIISSSGGGAPAGLAAHDTASIEITVAYTPSHGETDKQAMARLARLMKLVRKMEAAIIEAPEGADDHDEV
jgi:hypothetical protein